MKNEKKMQEWLRRAKSNLLKARHGKTSDEILYEDLCYDAHQAAEKALKAVFVAYGLQFPKTHDISFLIELLEKSEVKIPQELHRARALTEYAVETKYPGDYAPVSEEEFKESIQIAEEVVNWAESIKSPQ